MFIISVNCMKYIIKSLMVAASLFAAVMVNAGDAASVGVAAGYNNNYIVNGVVRSDASAFMKANNAVSKLRTNLTSIESRNPALAA